MPILKNIVISLLVTLVTLAGIFYTAKVDLVHLDRGVDNLGTLAVTNITSTDLLRNFPAVYNANLNLLNASKIDSASTTLEGVLSTPNLATVGTITTGTWNANTLTVPYGGTGSTTLAQFRVLLGSSTNPIGMVEGTGSAGQFLTSQGAGEPPIWQSATVNLNDDFIWNGEHYFGFGATATDFRVVNNAIFGSTTIQATSTAPFTIAGVQYFFPFTDNSSSSILATDGSGNLSWVKAGSTGAGRFLYGSNASKAVNDTAVETELSPASYTMEPNLLGSTGALSVKMLITNYTDSGSDDNVTLRLYLNGTQACATGLGTAQATFSGGWIEWIVFKDNSTTNTFCIGSRSIGTTVAGSEYIHSSSNASSTIDTTGAVPIKMTAQWNADDAGNTENFSFGLPIITFLGRSD